MRHRLDVLIRKVNRVKFFSFCKLFTCFKKVIVLVSFIGCASISSEVWSENYYWVLNSHQSSTALEGCRYSVHSSQGFDHVVDSSIGVSFISHYSGLPQEMCEWSLITNGPSGAYTTTIVSGGSYRMGDSCPSGLSYNDVTGSCSDEASLGKPDILACAGNPISVNTGNKYQQEVDYSDSNFVFSRFYNSGSGVWRTSFSDRIYYNPSLKRLMMVRSDGSTSLYTLEGELVKSDYFDAGELRSTDVGWRYNTNDHQELNFNVDGRLVSSVDAQGRMYDITYSNDVMTISSLGSYLKVTSDSQGQPLSLQTPSGLITYAYQNYVLVRLNSNKQGRSSTREFKYEDKRNASLLTGIIDERGVRFATWSYDDQGRAISSQHSGGAGLTQVAYNADGSSTVTNELGKTTVYRYQQIGGVKRVTAIEGEPSANCPASNSSYTYNDRGQMLTKTDAKGLVTAYTYNDRGLETSRTEASGTPLARTVTTEWDPDRFLPTKVVEPTRVTVYNYDNQGRELSRQVTSR